MRKRTLLLLLPLLGFTAGYTVSEQFQMPLEQDMDEIIGECIKRAHNRMSQYWASGCAVMYTDGVTWNGTPFSVGFGICNDE